MAAPIVLIVEDEPQIRRFVRGALEAQGWHVHEAGTLQRGSIEAGTRKPDLLLLDLGLPHGDGLALLAEWRAAGHAWLAKWHLIRLAQAWSPDPAADATNWKNAARTALECEPEHALGRALLGHAHAFLDRNLDQAGAELDAAIAADPKSADQVKAGNAKAINALKGAVMKLSAGKANPKLVDEILKKQHGPGAYYGQPK